MRLYIQRHHTAVYVCVREDDFREGCERDFRGKEQALLDQIGENERGMVDLRDALRAEILLRLVFALLY